MSSESSRSVWSLEGGKFCSDGWQLCLCHPGIHLSWKFKKRYLTNSRVNRDLVTSHGHGVGPQNVANITQVVRENFLFCWYDNDENYCVMSGWCHFLCPPPPTLLFPNGICAVAVSGSRYLTSNIRIDAIRKLAFFNDLLPTRYILQHWANMFLLHFFPFFFLLLFFLFFFSCNITWSSPVETNAGLRWGP
jgi:hypothetical protein